MASRLVLAGGQRNRIASVNVSFLPALSITCSGSNDYSFDTLTRFFSERGRPSGWAASKN